MNAGDLLDVAAALQLTADAHSYESVYVPLQEAADAVERAAGALCVRELKEMRDR